MREVTPLRKMCLDKIAKEEASKCIKNYFHAPMFFANPNPIDLTDVPKDVVDDIKMRTNEIKQEFRWGY